MRKFNPLIYLVTDPVLHKLPFYEALDKALLGGVTLVQLREKQLSTREFVIRAEKVKEICKRYGVPLIINDRVDICMAVDADGVHLGKDDIPLETARRILGLKKIIGVSVHSPSEARIAEEQGADYVAVSPVFYTSTKADIERPLGLEGLGAIAEAVSIPVIGIGGINLENASSVLDSGAAGVAIVSYIFNSTDPEKAVKELYESLRPLWGDNEKHF